MALEHNLLAPVPRVPGQGILRRIGNTPLLRFQRVTRGLDAEVLAKAERVLERTRHF